MTVLLSRHIPARGPGVRRAWLDAFSALAGLCAEARPSAARTITKYAAWDVEYLADLPEDSFTREARAIVTEWLDQLDGTGMCARLDRNDLVVEVVGRLVPVPGGLRPARMT